MLIGRDFIHAEDTRGAIRLNRHKESSAVGDGMNTSEADC